MAGSIGGCGCGSIGGGSSAAAYAQQAPAAQAQAAYQSPTQAAPLAYSSSGVTPVGQQGREKGPGVRDPQRAAQSLTQVQQAVARFADFSAATANGFKRNPASGSDAIQHYVNDSYDKTGNNSNLANPATLMYDMSGSAPRLVGVMYSAYESQPLPDFGAGAWHRHAGDDKVHMHVWFDKPVGEAFENNLGYV